MGYFEKKKKKKVVGVGEDEFNVCDCNCNCGLCEFIRVRKCPTILRRSCSVCTFSFLTICIHHSSVHISHLPSRQWPFFLFVFLFIYLFSSNKRHHFTYQKKKHKRHHFWSFYRIHGPHSPNTLINLLLNQFKWKSSHMFMYSRLSSLIH